MLFKTNKPNAGHEDLHWVLQIRHGHAHDSVVLLSAEVSKNLFKE